MQNEFEVAANKLAVERKTAAAAERKRVDDVMARQQADQAAATQAKAKAEERWPEIRALLGRAVDTYNQRSADLHVNLALSDEMVMRSWLQPYRLTITKNHRSISIIFTIGQANHIGYSIEEKMLAGHRSIIASGMPKKGGVDDIVSFVNSLVAAVAEMR